MELLDTNTLSFEVCGGIIRTKYKIVNKECKTLGYVQAKGNIFRRFFLWEYVFYDNEKKPLFFIDFGTILSFMLSPKVYECNGKIIGTFKMGLNKYKIKDSHGKDFARFISFLKPTTQNPAFHIRNIKGHIICKIVRGMTKFDSNASYSVKFDGSEKIPQDKRKLCLCAVILGNEIFNSGSWDPYV